MAFTSIDGFPVDLVVSEEHGLESDITDHPVEDGSDISDNIRNKPRTLTLSNAIVSDYPIGEIATHPTRSLGDSLPPPARAAWLKLVAIHEAKQPVVVVTNFERYESMGLESVTAPRESKNHGGLVFTAKFKFIRIVQFKRVTQSVPNGGPRQKLGLRQSHNPDRHHILWRKGKPPGSYTIVGQEIVFADDTTVFGTFKHRTNTTRFFHDATGVLLNNAENDAFYEDLTRDDDDASARAKIPGLNAVNKGPTNKFVTAEPVHNAALAQQLSGLQPQSAPRDTLSPTILNP